MCEFITATLPISTDQEQAAAVFRKHGFGFRPIINRHVANQVPDALHILMTPGQCDCGTVVGALHDHRRQPEDTTVLPEAELKKLRKQGWSEGKIQRWLQEKLRTAEKDTRTTIALAESRRPEASRWCDFITELLLSGIAKRIGLIRHTYSGSIETERITIKSRSLTKYSELTPETIMSIDDDTLCEFC